MKSVKDGERLPEWIRILEEIREQHSKGKEKRC
jgi:hypothetical protein